jgi:hypothetical protein
MRTDGENKKPRRLAPAGFLKSMNKSLPSDVAYNNDDYDRQGYCQFSGFLYFV